MKTIKCCKKSGCDDPECCQDLGFCDRKYPLIGNIYDEIDNEPNYFKQLIHVILMVFGLCILVLIFRIYMG